MIIGVTGTIGSGKGTFCKGLERYTDFSVFSFGNLVREEAKRRRIEETRENLQELGFRLRREEGRPAWAIKMADKILSLPSEGWIIDGFRYPDQVNYFKNCFGKGFRLMSVDAFPWIRFKFLRNRGREGDPRSYEEFLEQDKRDKIGYLQGIGQNTERCITMTEPIYRVYNHGSETDLIKEAKSKLLQLGLIENFPERLLVA